MSLSAIPYQFLLVKRVYPLGSCHVSEQTRAIGEPFRFDINAIRAAPLMRNITPLSSPMAFQTLAKTLSLNAQCLRPVFGYKKTPGTVRCRVFSLARLACHPAAGAAHSTWFLLAVGRILLHTLLIALHILWA